MRKHSIRPTFALDGAAWSGSTIRSAPRRRAARNAAVDPHRIDDRQGKVLARWGVEMARLDQDFDADPAVDERAALLRAAIEQLSGRRRTLVEPELDGLHDTAALAALVGCTPGAVRVLRHRAYADMRRLINSEHDGINHQFQSDSVTSSGC